MRKKKFLSIKYTRRYSYAKFGTFLRHPVCVCVCVVCAVLILLMLTVPRVTVNAAVSSPHYMPVGCRTYSEHGGQLERCQGLYTLERTWDEAIARCRSDGWTGLVMSDTEDVETTVGDFLMWMDDELDADNGYSAWIGGHEIDDRVWTWNDGTTFQRQSPRPLFTILHLLA